MSSVTSGVSQFLFIENDIERTNEDEILEYMQNQISTEIRSIIESHNANWIPYQPKKSQNSNPFDTDDHTISSIERI